jgi:hypothetical protein
MDGVVELQAIRPEGSTSMSHCKRDIVHCMALYYIYTGCPGRNVKNFGRVFLMLKYTDITQNTYIQS